MTRKDYVAIAEVLRTQYHRTMLDYNNAEVGIPDGLALAGNTAVKETAEELADMLHRDNPRFDREHFLAVVRGERELTSRPRRAGRTVCPKCGFHPAPGHVCKWVPDVGYLPQ